MHASNFKKAWSCLFFFLVTDFLDALFHFSALDKHHASRNMLKLNSFISVFYIFQDKMHICYERSHLQDVRAIAESTFNPDNVFTGLVDRK